MKQLKYTITDPDGIHARPAGMLVKRMQEFPCAITVAKGEAQADGKKLFALMKLAVKSGETVCFTADGDQEEAAIAAVEEVLHQANL